jgi:hypothetical protein
MFKVFISMLSFFWVVPEPEDHQAAAEADAEDYRSEFVYVCPQNSFVRPFQERLAPFAVLVRPYEDTVVKCPITLNMI